MKKLNVAVVGATGMVGQRFLRLLAEHPWFNVTVLAASARSAGKTYREAVGNKWAFDCAMPEKYAKMTVMDAILMATGAPSVDDPETVEVNEREESEKAIREMVSFYAEMLKESSIVELNMDPSIEEDERAEYIEKAREDAKAQIAEIEKLFSYQITFDKDGNATASFEIKVEDETTIEVVITDVITIIFYWFDIVFLN